MKKIFPLLVIIFVITSYFAVAQVQFDTACSSGDCTQKCVEVRRNGAAVKLCATCGDKLCEEGEDGCYSSSCTNDACTNDCGTGLSCPSDCETKVCPLIKCAAPPDGCRYKEVEDENGCPTCGTLVCDDRCKADSDCPTIACFAAPCPQNKCIDGTCQSEYCNGVCEDDDVDSIGCKPCDTDHCLGLMCKQGRCPSDCKKDPVCGNGKCEDGEADYCPPCTKDPVNPCKIKCTAGTCPGDCQKVTEQVKCVFKNSKEEQKCYSDKGNTCSGVEACVADVSGHSGEQVTWKSSCGGYAYTTIDGENEYANFECHKSECGDGICSSDEFDCPHCTTEPCLARPCINKCPKDCDGKCPTNNELEDDIKKCKTSGRDYETYEKDGCKFVRCIGNDKVECKKYKDGNCVIISCVDGYRFNSCDRPCTQETGECTITRTDDGCQITKCTDGRETKSCPSDSESGKSSDPSLGPSSSGEQISEDGNLKPSCGFFGKLFLRSCRT